jgi:RND superfamily putative drug exporter
VLEQAHIADEIASLPEQLDAPALVHVLGRANWWVPERLARVHDRLGLSKSAGCATGSAPEAGPASSRSRLIARRVRFGQENQPRRGRRV